jgi:thiol-disulfide isomerase/thioredoxin
MKLTTSLLFCCLIFLACNKKSENIAIISGKGLSQNIKRVYLTTAAEWSVFLDSAECKNGNFEIKYQPSSKLEPFLASICYLDSAKKITQLYIRNELLIKKTGKNSANGAFMLDYGNSEISYIERKNGSDLVNMTGGKENELFKQYEWQNFGHIGSEKDLIRYTNNRKLIKQNSKSYYFLYKISENREKYSRAQLEKVFGDFDETLQRSVSGSYLKEYIKNMPQPNEMPADLSGYSNDGNIEVGINKTANLNMLIFWASWCGPCRMEIPELKKIRDLIKNKDFFMASISIDKNLLYWKKALKEEQMGWPQFIIMEKDLNKTMAKYRFSSIPLIVFTDKNGHEIKRFSGYNANQTTKYITFIKGRLSLN